MKGRGKMAAEGSRRGRRLGSPNMICACMLRQERMRQEQAAAAPPPPPAPVAPTVEKVGRTLQLFPVRAGAAMAWQRPPEMVKTPSRMTIVYGGKVIKVENVPADKGKQVNQMAQSVNNPPSPESVVVVDVPDEEPAQDVAEPSAAITVNQARKLSLERFLGKRKESSMTDDPDDASPSKKMDAAGDGEPSFEDVPDASWLSL